MSRAQPSTAVDLHVRFVLVFAVDRSAPEGPTASLQRVERGRTKVVYVNAKVSKPAVEDRWPTDPKEFGRAIRQARQAARINQEDLAKQIGISDTTLRTVESARRKLSPAVRSWIVEALAKLGISAQ